MSSLHFALHDPETQILKAKRAQDLDDDRKPRFFDPKRRLIGVDIDALKAQVLEKQKLRADDRETDKKFQAYDDMIRREYRAAQIQETFARKSALQQLNDFRRIEQRKEYRREFDLNDPQYLCKSLPMCCGDNDPRIKSKGSLLRFDGEDYDGLRGKRSSVRLKEFLEKQIEENTNLKTSMKVADLEWLKEAVMESEFNQKCLELEEQAKRQEIKQLEAYNTLLAKETKTKKQTENKTNDAEVLAHMYNCLTSDFFLESANAAAGALGKTRINANNFKGLSESQLRDFKAVQMKQILDRKSALEAEKAMENCFNVLESVNCHDFRKTKEKSEQQRRDEARRISDINKILAIEQRLRRKESDRMQFENNPTDEFFAQFNKSIK